MYYSVVEEATEATVMYTDNLQEAIDYAKSLKGKHLVIDDNDGILYDSRGDMSFKI